MSSRFVFDGSLLRYRDRRSGRLVSATQAKSVAVAANDRGASEVRAISGQLQRGEISVQQWEVLMRDQVRSASLNSLALARGGYPNLTAADYGRVGFHLSNGAAGAGGQFQYLRRLAQQVEDGLPLDGRFLRRAEMYVQQANGFYEAERTLAAEGKGFDEVRSLRHVSDSCRGCVDQAAKGWMLLRGGEYIAPGRRQCLSACRCSTALRNSTTGAVSE